MENKKRPDDTKTAACELLRRMQESASSLAVRYDDNQKPDALVPAPLQQYIASCLRALCAGGACERKEDKAFTARLYHNERHQWQVYFYRNGIVNVYRDGDLIAAADVRKPAGELEAKAFEMFANRLLDSLRLFI